MRQRDVCVWGGGGGGLHEVLPRQKTPSSLAAVIHHRLLYSNLPRLLSSLSLTPAVLLPPFALLPPFLTEPLLPSSVSLCPLSSFPRSLVPRSQKMSRCRLMELVPVELCLDAVSASMLTCIGAHLWARSLPSARGTRLPSSRCRRGSHTPRHAWEPQYIGGEGARRGKESKNTRTSRFLLGW